MQKELRKLKVTYKTREALHSTIALVTRRRRVPRTFIGYDIIRGTLFGLIDHPEYSFETAVEKAVSVCKMPGSPQTLEEGIEEAFECIDSELREADLYDENNRRMTDREVLEKVINILLNDIYKDFCYSVTITYIRNLGLPDDLRTDILKNMLFKKIVADNSTEECIYDYAFRKSYVWTESREISTEEIHQMVDEALGEIPDNLSAYEYVMKMADQIYAENKVA